ncbi:hypothetical protein J6590_052341 [Homalodisca vitripennis]|nr:hypothetical protein J6590_052341 [Homalodisca vitripennis]
MGKQDYNEVTPGAPIALATALHYGVMRLALKYQSSSKPGAPRRVNMVLPLVTRKPRHTDSRSSSPEQHEGSTWGCHWLPGRRDTQIAEAALSGAARRVNMGLPLVTRKPRHTDSRSSSVRSSTKGQHGVATGYPEAEAHR